ncbi:MAG: GNAT family N-acetyltransferase [Bacteroidetes bacterium]|nr:GNAT family N-acetyltransferase [Bacteroidota bacterium]
MKRLNIRPLQFSSEKKLADEMLKALHDSEHTLNPNTANWKDISMSYLQHVQECINECEGVFLVAEIGKETVGFIFGYIDELDDSNFERGAGSDLYVSEGFVKPEYRKMGIYTALNSTFEKHFSHHNIRRIYRYTLVANTTMQRWLAQAGYQAVRMVYEKWKL